MWLEESWIPSDHLWRLFRTRSHQQITFLSCILPRPSSPVLPTVPLRVARPHQQILPLWHASCLNRWSGGFTQKVKYTINSCSTCFPTCYTCAINGAQCRLSFRLHVQDTCAYQRIYNIIYIYIHTYIYWHINYSYIYQSKKDTLSW